MCRELDEVLAYHCGPALLGLKAANLVSVAREDIPDLEVRIGGYQRLFEGRGVRFRLMCGCGRRALLLVYRQELLQSQLAHPLARELLRRDGYPLDGELEELLDHLALRLAGQREFPHEIGLFLGYPPEDVEGFQVHRGRDCKLCGHWKVYSDVERAQALFRRYDRCRAALCRRLAQGVTLSQMFQAAS